MKQTKSFKFLIAAMAVAMGAGAVSFTPDIVPRTPAGTVGKDSTDMATQLRAIIRAPKGNGSRPLPTSRQNAAAEADFNLYGGVLYADTWTTSNHPYGIYKATSKAPIEVQKHYLGDMFTVQGGGFYNEGKYYFINYEIQNFDGQEYVYTTLYECETMPFKQTKSYKLGMDNIARDLTFDPIEQQIYGIFSVGNLEATYLIGRMPLGSSERDFNVETLVPLDETTNQVAIAADALGTVYTIGADGNLYRLDKQARSLVKIGATGVRDIEIKYPQSATIDTTTGTFYWAALFTDGTSALYTVDPTTGEATRVGYFPDNEEFAGLYVPIIPASGAPVAVEELFPTFEDGSLSGNVAFDAPKVSVGGGKLSGNLTYRMSVNGEEKYTGEVRAGKRNEEVEMTLPSNGWYTFKVTTENGSGRSIPKSMRVYVGHDRPVACSNPRAVNENRGGEVDVTWGKSRYGVNGGYVDTLSVTYDVVRMPDNIPVATALTDTVCHDKIVCPDLHTYYYVITPNFGEMKGEPASTNKVVVGHIAQAPYIENFDTDVDFSTWSVQHLGPGVLNPNTNWGTWNHTGYAGGVAQSSPCDNTAKDDWLFSPPIHLSPERTYNLYFKAMSQGNSIVPSFIEHLEVKMGRHPDVTAMSTTLVEDGAVTNEYTKWSDYAAVIHVEEEGEYHIGFHATTPAADLMWMLNIDDVSVQPGEAADGPARVTDFSVEALPHGELGAKISFKAPARKIDNTPLESIDRIELSRGETVIKTFDKPAPGAPLEYTDKEAMQGDNRYSVVAYADDKKGLSDAKTVFVGFDVPGEVSEVRLSDVDGVPVVTWNKPAETGRNGHYVDPDGVTYSVTRYFSARDREVVAEGITSLRFEDKELKHAGQDPVAYIITATNGVGSSEGVSSNSIFVGDALSEVPLSESFPRCMSTSVLAYVSASEEAAWAVLESCDQPAASPVDNDGGMAVFYLAATGQVPAEGYSAMLYTNRFSLDNLIKPAVRFYVFGYPSSSNMLSLMVNPESRGWEEAVTIPVKGETGWTQVVFPLDEYKDSRYIQIGFKGTAHDYGYVLMDNILFDDMLDHNLQLKDFTAQGVMELGESQKLTATVCNRGLNDAAGYVVRFINNDITIANVEGSRIAPGMSTDVSFDFTATLSCEQQNRLRAEVVYEPDMKPTDNVSEEKSMYLDLPRMAYVNDLKGTKTQNGIRLDWSVPDASTAQPEPVCDGFDDYSPFIISDIGDWTLVDGDKQPTWGISSGTAGQILQYDHAGEAMAWQVFNPVKAGLSLTYDPSGDPNGLSVPDWRPRSGSQMLISYAPKSGSSDDWLISPRLDDNVQLVKFFVRSVLNAYPERFQILYSTSGNAPEDFTLVEERTVNMKWTAMAVVLPADARYFAIRCTSPQQFALLLDDVTYAPEGAPVAPATLLGYNVYVDGIKVTPEPVKACGYDVTGGAATARYGVTAVYDRGESRMSNVVQLENSAIDGIYSDSDAEYFTLQGFPVDASRLVPGIYIRRTGKSSGKVMVR